MDLMNQPVFWAIGVALAFLYIFIFLVTFMPHKMCDAFMQKLALDNSGNPTSIRRNNWIKARLDKDFPDGAFTFMDVDGGDGAFTDWLLEQYPLSFGIVVERFEHLLSKNKPSPRKDTVLAGYEALPEMNNVDVLFTPKKWFLETLINKFTVPPHVLYLQYKAPQASSFSCPSRIPDA